MNEELKNPESDIRDKIANNLLRRSQFIKQ